MKVGTNNLSNLQLPVEQQLGGCVFAGYALASPSHSANSFTFCQIPSAAAGHHAEILQAPPIIAGLPSTGQFAGDEAVQHKDAKEQRHQAGGIHRRPSRTPAKGEISSVSQRRPVIVVLISCLHITF